MEEYNDIFLAGGDALVYLTEPMRKKYSTKLVWGHPFSTYIFYDLFFNSPFPVRTCKHLGWPPRPFPQLRMYLMVAYFSTKKQITFHYRLHWDINIRKKNISLRAIPVQRYCSSSQSLYLTLMACIITHFKSYLSQCF